ncbi:MAG TPA: RNA-directed DNA polymerase, partial [Puia sp.]|nr:RNA-directed DNA polymerase [Puia sp.]
MKRIKGAGKQMLEKFINIGDIYIAYKKAKFEAFYESSHYNSLEFSEYETNLEENLSALYKTILENDLWSSDINFIGTHSYLPKSLNCECWNGAEEGHFRSSDPLTEWHRSFRITKKKPEISLRQVIKPTVNFQIISALWILKVGYIFDSILDHKTCYANRIRNSSGRPYDYRVGYRNINKDSNGIFVPYFSAYQKWRAMGLRSMERALNDKKNILAITMDIEKFYHRASPNFLLRNSFLREFNIELSTSEKLFTQIFVNALNTWYESTPDYIVRPEGALPVGLSASKIIANVILAKFDREITQNLNPIYYGRYVDDIFLVVENMDEIDSYRGASALISKALGRYASTIPVSGPRPSIRVKLPYAADSELIFSGAKQKIFSLTPEDGIDLIHSIREQMRAQSSEYRMLPVVPDNAVDMASRTLLSTPDATLQADALRKADTVSLRRLGLSLLLRDVEFYAEDLPPRTWQKARLEFYDMVEKYLISPQGYFEFNNYIPRVFGLMVSCRDVVDAHRLLDRLFSVFLAIETTAAFSKKADLIAFRLCQVHTLRGLNQILIQSLTQRNNRIENAHILLAKRLAGRIGNNEDVSINTVTKAAQKLLFSDLAKRPYKDFWYYSQKSDAAAPAVPRSMEIRKTIKLANIRKFRTQATTLKQPYWPALAFPTRPLRIDEMVIVAPKLLENERLFKRSVMALRGAKVSSNSVKIRAPASRVNENVNNFFVPNNHLPEIVVAVTSFETSQEQWERAALGKPERSLHRYKKLNSLVNRILSDNTRPNYIAFPELSVPLRWALRLSRKLTENSISLIAGIEYRKDHLSRKLRNDALISLTTTWPGYPSNIVYLQSKFK